MFCNLHLIFSRILTLGNLKNQSRGREISQRTRSFPPPPSAQDVYRSSLEGTLSPSRRQESCRSSLGVEHSAKGLCNPYRIRCGHGWGPCAGSKQANHEGIQDLQMGKSYSLEHFDRCSAALSHRSESFGIRMLTPCFPRDRTPMNLTRSLFCSHTPSI